MSALTEKPNTDVKYLKPLKPFTEQLKENFISFDCETYGNKNKFYLVCFYGRYKGKIIKQHFFNKDQAIKFIRKHYSAKFVATNLQFDYTVLFDEQQYATQYCFSGSLIFKIVYKLGLKKKATMHDTLAFFPASVKKLGEIVKAPKLDAPWDLAEQRKPNNNIEKRKLVKYCYRDAKISYKFFKLIQEFTIKEQIKMKNTVSSLSLEMFRRNYITRPYRIENVDNLKIVFKGYYGGRTEVFKRGTFENINYYDFNSLYPTCMLNAMPDPDSVKEDSKVTRETIMKFEGVSKVTIEIPKMYIPPLPYRDKDYKLTFPYGTLTGYWTHVEIRNALEHGATLIKIFKGTYYTKTCNPFNRFINEMYNKRLIHKAKNSQLEVFYKLMMNSLYGKFAYRFYDTSEIILKDELTAKKLMECTDIEELNEMHPELSDLFLTVHKTEQWENVTTYSIPIWSAYTTAYGRIKMFKALQDPLIQKNVCYIDTDSMMLKDFTEQPTGNKLGDLKLECPTVKNGTFIKPKFYNLIKPRIKGFSKIGDTKSFLKAIHEREIEQTKFTKVKTAIKSKPTGKHGQLTFNQTLTLPKKINLEDSKRDWNNKLFNNGCEKYTETFTKQDSKPIYVHDLVGVEELPTKIASLQGIEQEKVILR